MLTAFLPVIFLTACKEDTITNTNNNHQIPVIDSNIFSWEYIPVEGWNFYDSYIADTNAVFYVMDEKVFLYDGNISIQLDNNVEGESLCIDGINSNEIYIGGRYTGNNSYRPFFKKWIGSGFEDIILPADSNDQVLEICAENSNSVWFAGVSGKIYKYDGVSITPHFIDLQGIYPRLFIKDNQLYFYSEKYPNNTTISYLYKYSGNQWEFIKADTSQFVFSYFTAQLQTFGNNVLRKSPEYLMEYNNNNWTPFVNTPTFETYSVSGNSLSDLLCMGIPEGTLEFFPYYYNGQKWLKQNRAIPENIFYGFPVELKYCNGKYFGFYYALEIISHNYIAVGKMNTPPGK